MLLSSLVFIVAAAFIINIWKCKERASERARNRDIESALARARDVWIERARESSLERACERV